MSDRAPKGAAVPEEPPALLELVRQAEGDGMPGALAAATALVTRLPDAAIPDGVLDRLVRLQEQAGDLAQALLLERRAGQMRLRRQAEAAEAARSDAARALDGLRQTMDRLVRQEKMANLGQLVAGVAHEINTPLGVAVTGASQLSLDVDRLRHLYAERRLKAQDLEEFLNDTGEASRIIQVNCERAAALIQNFKAVAVDQSSDDTRPFDLAAHIHDVLGSMSPQVRRGGHTVRVDCPEGLVVEGRPGALSHALTNLLLNALTHAFEPGQAGSVCITARLLPGDQVRIRFADNGRGIPGDIRPRIFEPFFTTRRAEGGSGLGLHIVHTVVTQAMNGTVTVETSPGAGTAFILTFPRRSKGGRRILSGDDLSMMVPDGAVSRGGL